MTKRILQIVLVSLALATGSLAQQPVSLKLERDDFLREVLSDKPSARTLYYDTGVAGGYQILKTDVVRALPEAAGRQSLNLRGLLMIGPYGPTNVVFVYVFIGEKASIRVNQLTVAQARFTYKSTGKMTPVQFQSFFDGLLKATVLLPGPPGNDSGSESTYETVLARWSNGKFDSYYGSMINPRPGANVNDFAKLVGRLLQSLTKTYPLNKGDGKPPR